MGVRVILSTDFVVPPVAFLESPHGLRPHALRSGARSKRCGPRLREGRHRGRAVRAGHHPHASELQEAGEEIIPTRHTSGHSSTIGRPNTHGTPHATPPWWPTGTSGWIRSRPMSLSSGRARGGWGRFPEPAPTPRTRPYQQALGEEVAKAVWDAATAVDDVYTWVPRRSRDRRIRSARGRPLRRAAARRGGRPDRFEVPVDLPVHDAHHIVLYASNLIDALHIKDLPYGIPRKLGGGLDDRVRRLRPLLEHWEEQEPPSPPRTRPSIGCATATRRTIPTRRPGRLALARRVAGSSAILAAFHLRAAVEPFLDQAEALLEQRRRETERHDVAQSLAHLPSGAPDSRFPKAPAAMGAGFGI